MREALLARGAAVTTVPLIRLVPPGDEGAALRGAVRALARYDWVAFSSTAAVRALAGVMTARPGSDSGLPSVAAVGPATAGAAAEYLGVAECLLPDVFRGEALAAAILGAGQAARSAVQGAPDARAGGMPVLVVQAENGSPALVETLRGGGAVVDVAPAYAVADRDPAVVSKTLDSAGQVDWVVLASSSAARALSACGVGLRTMRARVAAISPVTAETAQELGFTVGAVADPHTGDGIVDAIVTTVESERRALTAQ